MKAALALLLLGAAAQDRPADPEPEITPQAQAAVKKALDFLASRQARGGYISGSSVPVAATSMACLAFLAEGSTPRAGRYAENIRRGLVYLRRTCTKSGYISDDTGSGMYGHGYATLFLAETFGMLSDPSEIDATRDALSRAVTLLEKTQNCFGGWNTAPDGTATDDGSGAIAIMQIMALRAARNAGLQVNPETVRKAKKYLQEMTSPEGWYAYNYNMRGGGQQSSACTGAGMYMLGVMDLHADPRYEKGIRNLMAGAPFLGKGGGGRDQGWSSWWPYTCFYASLAIFQHGGDEWRKWYPAMRDDLIKKQSPDGSWSGDAYGGLYTAFCVLSLELPFRYLPIFQDGGRGREGK